MTGERIKGMAEEAGGNIKKTVGDAIDNEQMQAEGAMQAAQGEARQEAAKAGERVRGVGEEITGNVKQVAGDLLDNEQMQAEGTIDEKKGEVRRKLNQ